MRETEVRPQINSECYLQVMMRGYRSNGNVEELLKQSQMELSWIQRQLAMVSIRNTHLHTKGKVFQHSSICTHRETKWLGRDFSTKDRDRGWARFLMINNTLHSCYRFGHQPHLLPLNQTPPSTNRQSHVT
ncbi:unnamed protein product [Arctogadus glacialis]